MEKPPIPSPTLLVRLQAWQAALSDSAQYIALARQVRTLFPEGSGFEHREGWTTYEHAATKALVAAAIVSACQILVPGNAHPDCIASNRELHETGILAFMYAHSDKFNGWSSGHSERTLANARVERDKFVGHYDGSHANIVRRDDTAAIKSWRPPNPWYIPDAFEDLEKTTAEMAKYLRALLSYYAAPELWKTLEE